MTPKQMFDAAIGTFEGQLSLVANDNGNWFDRNRFLAHQPQRRGMGDLIGSKCGVTGYAWCVAMGSSTVNRRTMETITPAIAAEIGMVIYYRRPNLDRLPWNRATASIVDKSWGSGPVATIKRLQRLLQLNNIDGIITPGGATEKLYTAWIARVGEEAAARAWCAVRHEWDLSIATNDGPNDPDRIFLRGWNRRSDAFIPGGSVWKAW